MAEPKEEPELNREETHKDENNSDPEEQDNDLVDDDDEEQDDPEDEIKEDQGSCTTVSSQPQNQQQKLDDGSTYKFQDGTEAIINIDKTPVSKTLSATEIYNIMKSGTAVIRDKKTGQILTVNPFDGTPLPTPKEVMENAHRLFVNNN